MTKYILNSGNAKRFPEKEKALTDEILSGFGDEVKVLFCFFSQPREDWDIKFEKYKEGFLKSVDGGKEITFEMALPDGFEEQVKNCDVIMLQGGDDHLLRYWLEKFDIPKIWDGKVVSASSAGSNVLVSSFWTCDWRECMKGMNIIPIKFIPHFNSDFGVDDPRGEIDWEKGLEDLKKYDDMTMSIHALEEGEFIVVEK